MMNYMKSEFYRVAKSRTLYIMTAILAGLTVFMNTALYVFVRYDPDFAYATVRFSLNTLTAELDLLFIAGAAVVALLYADDIKNGTFKNAVAFGIPRSGIYIARYIVSLVSATVMAAVILAFYISSAYLLLSSSGAEEALFKLFEGIGAAYPSIMASMAMISILLVVMNSTVVTMITWYALTYAAPAITLMLGSRIRALGTIAEWLPTNFLSFEVTVTSTTYDCLWNTPFGLFKCIAAGLGLTAIFMAAGLMAFRRKEV